MIYKPNLSIPQKPIDLTNVKTAICRMYNFPSNIFDVMAEVSKSSVPLTDDLIAQYLQAGNGPDGEEQFESDGSASSFDHVGSDYNGVEFEVEEWNNDGSSADNYDETSSNPSEADDEKSDTSEEVTNSKGESNKYPLSSSPGGSNNLFLLMKPSHSRSNTCFPNPNSNYVISRNNHNHLTPEGLEYLFPQMTFSQATKRKVDWKVFLLIRQFRMEHGEPDVNAAPSQRELAHFSVQKHLLRYQAETGDDTCGICLEGMKLIPGDSNPDAIEPGPYQETSSTEHEMVRILPCTHIYHANCIANWFANNIPVCPMCRMDHTPLRRRFFKKPHKRHA